LPHGPRRNRPNDSEASWAKIDEYVKAELAKIKAGGKKIRIISATVNSPSTKAAIADFTAQYPSTKHIQVDAVSYTGIIKANENSFGKTNFIFADMAAGLLFFNVLNKNTNYYYF
jgi:molybdopterin-containing oxidoreductase family iron-sulfur binding subunit